eukprot:gnl/TRDRNA2_/TRDRNA2_46138_c0_seq1.p1 gnl/TRDRNA2_/TRDRNA2_46138_c0~~gnl/TRDRNA2_/TRDRNA2_46138_c0_seq1.p1  ORF type:complete len:612 (-),score=104.43 gnl/TRDRNA2_/TRDRNA2_46138_c0_seq1:39-1874(-)
MEDDAPRSCTGNTHSQAIAQLKAVYSAVKGDGFGRDHVPKGNKLFLNSSNLQYGEVTHDGMESFYKALQVNMNDVFYDLGSGIGKLVLYVAMRGEVSRSVGIEIGERRHCLAEDACSKLKTELEHQLVPGDEGTVTSDHSVHLSAPCSEFSVVLGDLRCKNLYLDATLIGVSNVCFGESVMSKLLDNVLRQPSSVRRLVSLTQMLHKRLKLVRTLKVSCTWAKITTWYIYDVLPPGASAPPSGSLARASSLPAGRRLSASDSAPALLPAPPCLSPGPSQQRKDSPKKTDAPALLPLPPSLSTGFSQQRKNSPKKIDAPAVVKVPLPAVPLHTPAQRLLHKGQRTIYSGRWRKQQDDGASASSDGESARETREDEHAKEDVETKTTADQEGLRGNEQPKSVQEKEEESSLLCTPVDGRTPSRGSSKGSILMPACTPNLLCNWSPAGERKISALMKVLKEFWSSASSCDGTFFDLGCGDGRVGLEVCHVFPESRAVGVDLNIGLVDTAQARARKGSLEERCEFRVGDLVHVDLTEAAVVFMYLPPQAVNSCVKRVLPKSGLRPGALIISADGQLRAGGRRSRIKKRMFRWTSPEIANLFCYTWCQPPDALPTV